MIMLALLHTDLTCRVRELEESGRNKSAGAAHHGLGRDTPRPAQGNGAETVHTTSLEEKTAMQADAKTTTATDVADDAVDVDELVRTHLPLVGHAVRELLTRIPSHVHRDDLISAGMYALVLTAKSFDPTRGVPFGRFAAIRIKGALTDELRTMDWASRAVRTKARELDTVRTTLTSSLRRTPTRDEVATALGVSVRDMDNVDSDVQRASVVSLHALTPDAGADLVPTAEQGPEALLVHREQIGFLRDAIELLPERLRTVVEQYFFAQRKMADIATDLGVTESRISQLRSEALTMLRQGLQATESGPALAPVTGRRNRARAAYAAAVTTRSTLAERLAHTTPLGEPHALPIS
jgi:RNA polymerase sigma factor FliA